ncbi:hypothetical protein OBBRIDRAFT_796603 [Obba rivulosa]|uniref:Uncharacterized protein n=1 Tax=Obba rivulosa TaxID=1052685 RepID=A0A8E2DIN2_9APHY|nr:hypothetical protein OBBRIDRAFT_796603 [Obba rivulosa]
MANVKWKIRSLFVRVSRMELLSSLCSGTATSITVVCTPPILQRNMRVQCRVSMWAGTARSVERECWVFGETREHAMPANWSLALCPVRIMGQI